MTKSQLLKNSVPFLLLFLLLGLLWRELFYAKPEELPSALIGETIPEFSIPNLWQTNQSFSPKEFTGHVALLNVWATWCNACAAEHEMLMKIKQEFHVPIYSINYKDNITDAKKWLNQQGNPYATTGIDKNGDVAIDLGVYGTPETFIISPEGKIVYRHIGMIDEKAWNDVLYPIIKKYEQAA